MEASLALPGAQRQLAEAQAGSKGQKRNRISWGAGQAPAAIPSRGGGSR